MYRDLPVHWALDRAPIRVYPTRGCPLGLDLDPATPWLSR